jgi:calcium permeable stress-gated cation channel
MCVPPKPIPTTWLTFIDIAKLAGEPTLPQAELRTQNWYFTFQVIQVFLVTTFSSGAAAVATKIAQDPTLTPVLLARHLPQASNFYLAYILFQGTASAAKNVLNYTDLLEYLIYDRFFDKTPRDKYSRFTSMKNISWGSVYPKFANLAVIGEPGSCLCSFDRRGLRPL